ncbi:acid protease [Leucogyrophana mollusca]|uniref:Acid protease n=1 Tax=Leucogyrophana mollusca TaxID=85980 RepID=A0ACB8BWK0_9AGAM|nr:acid protease [Leucogyrophana mollusca]
MSGVAFVTGCILAGSLLVNAQDGPSWASLPMNVAPSLSDDFDAFNYVTVPMFFGTPPQEVNVTVDVAAGLLAAYALDCVLCSGNSFFDQTLSTTYESLNTTWDKSTATFSGYEVNDTVLVAGNLQVSDKEFVLINNGADQTMSARVQNGHLGLLLDPFNSTASTEHLFSRLHQAGQLLNPVVGMRFDPVNPRLTIGALDPNDYEGTINWVQVESPDSSWDFWNTFKIDGLKGYNGSFIPQGDNLIAGLDSLYIGVSIPNTYTYTSNEGYSGPIGTPATSPYQTLSYQCNETTPYIPLIATINGVDYQIDSKDNLLRPLAPVAPIMGYCNIGIYNRSDTALPNVALGLPFLRSVYVAYRFPTDNCPGYYGFAFPAGANRTQAQISQTPTSKPTNSAQCLSLTAPTSTPSSSVVTAQESLQSHGKYVVYGRPQASEVPLMGVDDFPKIVWNSTDLE